tara:strand:+ start:331 stop:663 length:333 start_codon:yes stop_codon:yes gene_type:complete
MSIITLNTGLQSHFAAQAQDVQGQINLDRLSDVTVTNPVANQILKYVAPSPSFLNGQWINTTTGSVTNLEDLIDVTVTAVSNGQVIAWNSTTNLWENADVTATLVDGGTY